MSEDQTIESRLLELEAELIGLREKAQAISNEADLLAVRKHIGFKYVEEQRPEGVVSLFNEDQYRTAVLRKEKQDGQ